MAVKDQLVADLAVPPELQSFLDLDSALGAEHEKFMLMQAGAEQYTAEQQKQIQESEAVYQEFKKQCLAVDLARGGGRGEAGPARAVLQEVDCSGVVQ